MLCRIHMLREVLNIFSYFGFELTVNSFSSILSNTKTTKTVITMMLPPTEGDDLGLG